MAKIKMKHSVTVADTFADFLIGKKAAGVGGKTLVTYANVIKLRIFCTRKNAHHLLHFQKVVGVFSWPICY